MKPTPPCYGCKERVPTPNCHITCEKYLEYIKVNNSYKEGVMEDKRQRYRAVYPDARPKNPRSKFMKGKNTIK